MSGALAHSRLSRTAYSIDKFGGNDLTNSPSFVAMSRSPHAPNMIRDVPGKVCKMTGYETLFTAQGAINGCHIIKDGGALLHAGTNMYRITSWDLGLPAPMTVAMANAKSKGVYLGDKLYIFDTKCVWVWSNEKLVRLDTLAKIPRVTIANLPSGGGAQYEQINMLTPRFIETFLGNGHDAVYSLSYAPLDAEAVSVRLQTADKSYISLREGYEFSVNRAAGKVMFNTPPPAPATVGEPNVEIRAAHTVQGYRDRINTAKVACVYGVGGAQDRIFAGASDEYPSRDYFSAGGDGTYFGDMDYSQLGAYDPIMGYSLLEGSLLTYKNSPFNSENIIVRKGTITDNKPVFSVSATLPAAGLASDASLGYIEGEPVYASGEGIMAVARADTDSSRYVQCRSFYLNGELTKCDMSKSSAVLWHDFYVLAAGDKLWLLDALQPTSRSEGMPWSTRQYEGYVREGCAACLVWQQDGRLFYGSKAGQVRRFREKSVQAFAYYDDDKPVSACWELADFGGKVFYKNKSFAYMAVLLASAPNTSVQVSSKANGVRRNSYKDSARAGYLSFANITFSKLTFRCDDTPRTLGARLRLKRVDKACFRFANDEAEPFGLAQVAFEYSQSGNFK